MIQAEPLKTCKAHVSKEVAVGEDLLFALLTIEVAAVAVEIFLDCPLRDCSPDGRSKDFDNMLCYLLQLILTENPLPRLWAS